MLRSTVIHYFVSKRKSVGKRYTTDQKKRLARKTYKILVLKTIIKIL